MTLSNIEKEKFEEVSKTMMKFLCNHLHPHATVIITGTSSELLEGLQSLYTNQFVKD